MKRLGIFIVALIAVVTFSCTFGAETKVVLDNTSHLDRFNYLALMHLEDNHEVTPEALESQLGFFLEGNAVARSASSPVSSVIGVQKFITEIENGFSSVTANKRSTTTEQEASEIPFYLFDIVNETEQTVGYAIACGDIRIPAILAVVEDGEFDSEEQHPFKDIFYNRLACYILETIEIYNSITDEDISTAVEKYNSISDGNRAFNDPNVLSILKPHTAPLVTNKTKWGQDIPYWDVINSIKGKTLPKSKVLTGCVATALAQIMAYHEWPAGPAATIASKTTFPDPYTNTTRTFSSVVYEWSQMKAKKDATELGNQYKMEIGVLMHEIGVAIKTNYGTDGSGAIESDVVANLSKLGYKKPTLADYSLAKVQASIDSYKPVYIGGYEKKVTTYAAIDVFKWFPQVSYDGGHAWLIDNYQTHFYSSTKKDEYVHCNLGWDGTDDGWYLSNVFDTRYGPITTAYSSVGYEDYFKYKLEIIYNITPNK